MSTSGKSPTIDAWLVHMIHKNAEMRETQLRSKITRAISSEATPRGWGKFTRKIEVTYSKNRNCNFQNLFTRVPSSSHHFPRLGDSAGS